MNKVFAFTGEDIGDDSIECNIDFKIYSDPARKEVALNKLDIYQDSKLFEALALENHLCFVESLYVTDSERGNGYGNDLMALCLDKADEVGIPIILALNSDESQEEGFDLEDFYRSLGFELIQESEMFEELPRSEIESLPLPIMVRATV